jgi:hypothetical protein
MLRVKPGLYVLFFISLAFYVFLGYNIQRHETLLLCSGYVSLFLIYIWILNQKSIDVKFWILASMAFRIVLILAIPQLSDDVYRFIWDGRLLLNGFSPYSFLPGHLADMELPQGISPSLYELLNSKGYYSIYPPVAQIFFWLAVVGFPDSILGSVVMLRIMIVAVEAGSIWLILRLLKLWEMDGKKVVIYALNPLVILELAGNLHFEAFVIFFLLLSIYGLTRKHIFKSGLGMALSIGAKLLPLILLPLFLIRLGLKKSMLFYLACLIGLMILFIPFYSSLGLSGFGESFGLYFRKFEFNASIYYLVREYGYRQHGFNIIQTAGWKLGAMATVIILIISVWSFEIKSGFKVAWRRLQYPESLRSVPEISIWVLLVYILFATTVHPWYILPILALSVFTPFRFPVVWSFLIFFTYAGYSTTGFTENIWMVGTEYLIVLGYLVYELQTIQKSKRVGYG